VFFIWSFVFWGFLIGTLAMWLYFGNSYPPMVPDRTAFCAGCAVWSLGYLMTSVTPFLLRLYPRRILAVAPR